MCIILDTNQWGNFLNPSNEDMKPIHKWLEKRNGKLLYSNHEDLKKEWGHSHIRKLEEYKLKGRAKLVPCEKVKEKIKEIEQNHKLKSNKEDIPILGLAKASDAKLLCSSDQKLHEDFKKVINGNIYQNKSHRHLLTLDICP